MQIPMLRHDLANHWVWVSAIATIISIPFGTIAGAVAVVAAALFKDVLLDLILKKGTPSGTDFAFSIIGGAVVLLPQYLGIGLIYGPK